MENAFSQNMTDLDSIVFPNTDQPSSYHNYAYCQVCLLQYFDKLYSLLRSRLVLKVYSTLKSILKVQNFSRRFYEPPVVLVSANRKQNLLSYLTDQNIVAWIKVTILKSVYK